MNSFSNSSLNSINNFDINKYNLKFNRNNKNKIVNNRFNSFDSNNNYSNENTENFNLYFNSFNNRDEDIYESEKEEELKEKIIKLRKTLKIEEEKVNNLENIIEELKESQRENEEKNITLSKEFNERENKIKLKYQKSEIEILEEANKKGNFYENNIKNLSKKIKDIEFENMKINQKINGLKNLKDNLENKFHSIEIDLNNELLQKSKEVQEFQGKFELEKQLIINKKEVYDQKIKELRIKLLQLKEYNSQRIQEILINNENSKDEIKDNYFYSNINLNKQNLLLNKFDTNNIRFNQTFNNFYYNLKNRRNKLFNEYIKSNDNYLKNLRSKKKILFEQSLKLTNILSAKNLENEEYNKEINILKGKIRNKKRIKNNKKKIDNYLYNKETKINEEDNINKIGKMKMIINDYKMKYARIKVNLDNKSIEHKLNIYNIVISYEKKIKKLIQKINCLKKMKSNLYKIEDDIKDNYLFDN